MAFGAKHVLKVLQSRLVDLRARSGTLGFRKFVGCLHPLWMIACPDNTLSPMVVITSEAVQVDFIIQEFVSVTSGTRSIVMMTASGFVVLGVVELRRFLGTGIDRLGRGAVFRGESCQGFVGWSSLHTVLECRNLVVEMEQ